MINSYHTQKSQSSFPLLFNTLMISPLIWSFHNASLIFFSKLGMMLNHTGNSKLVEKNFRTSRPHINRPIPFASKASLPLFSLYLRRTLTLPFLSSRNRWKNTYPNGKYILKWNRFIPHYNPRLRLYPKIDPVESSPNGAISSCSEKNSVGIITR